MWKTFALNLNCGYIFYCCYVNSKPPTGTCSFFGKCGCVYSIKFTGSDSRLYLCGQRSLVPLIYGALCFFNEEG